MSAGRWVFVCGPSGAGKDSVIAWAQQRLAGNARVVFARRMVTRPAGPSMEHDEVSRAAVLRLRDAGELAWHWEANGHLYAVPAHYCADVAAGHVVVVNGSREHVAALAPDATVHAVLVTASRDVLAARLLSRAREDAAQVAARLTRNAQLGPLAAGLVLHNEGALDGAGALLVAHLQAMVEAP